MSGPTLAVTGAAAAAGMAVGVRKLRPEGIPRAGVLASVFFVASFVHVPVGPASAHLVLNGLLGILLGWGVFPVMAVALFLQTVFFGYGGFTALGANTLNMGLSALIAGGLFHALRPRTPQTGRLFAAGAAAGAAGIALAALFLGLCMYASNRSFIAAVTAIGIAHVPVMIAEALVTGFAVIFLARVKPELLKGAPHA